MTDTKLTDANTKLLYQNDAYLNQIGGIVTSHVGSDSFILDQTIFYPTGGGQPGDSGYIRWDNNELKVQEAVKGPNNNVILRVENATILPPIGSAVQQEIDVDRRMQHMRIHTALHILSVVLPFPVTGGQISSDKGRLDFKMPAPSDDKETISNAINELVCRNVPVNQEWITEKELSEKPDLVKTMSVQPPRGSGNIRLIRIGSGDDTIDLQPCGGTHVTNTKEVGVVMVGKIENKGRENRRVTIRLT